MDTKSKNVSIYDSDVQRNISKKLAPQSIEAEQSFLGCIMLDNTIGNEVFTQCAEDDFYSEAHKIIYAGMLKLYSSGSPIDFVTLTDVLEKTNEIVAVGGANYLIFLAECVPSSVNYKSYLKIIKRHSLNRCVIEASQKIIHNTVESENETEALTFAEKLIYDISNKVDTSSLVDLKDSFTDVISKFSKIQTDKNAFRGLMTGFMGLDRLTNGLQKSDLILIAARPGVGKTSFATNMVENISVRNGGSCAVFSLEMPRVQLAQRMICGVANVSMGKALKGELNSDEWERLWSANELVSRAKIYVDDSSLVTPREMLSKCRRLKTMQGLDLVMIDYIQLMSGDNKKYDNRQQEISDISRNLKIMAKELNVPVIALSQLSRAAESAQRPQLSHLRESGAIEQDADIVMFIHRPDKVEANLEKVQSNQIPKDVAEIIIAKHRNGSLDSVNLKWVGEMTKFKNIDTQVDEIARSYGIEADDSKEEDVVAIAEKKYKETYDRLDDAPFYSDDGMQSLAGIEIPHEKSESEESFVGGDEYPEFVNGDDTFDN